MAAHRQSWATFVQSRDGRSPSGTARSATALADSKMSGKPAGTLKKQGSRSTAKSANQSSISSSVGSALEAEFAIQLQLAGLNAGCVREYQFAVGRKWRFDFCWPAQKVAAEIEGGIYSGGRHTRGKGFEEDATKYNEATLLGWRVLRFTGSMVRSGTALNLVDAMVGCPG